MIRAVLDTNVLVSALLFPGDMGRIVAGWKAGAFVPVFSHDTFDEFRRVLAYPKFSLTVQEKVGTEPYFCLDISLIYYLRALNFYRICHSGENRNPGKT